MATKAKGLDVTRGGQFALIPASILYDDQLPATAKLLYGEIYRLSHANGYCYASNRDFIEILRCSEATITRLISALADQGHIRVKLVRRYGSKGDIIQRRIFCGQELAKEDPPDEAEDGAGGPLKNEDTSPQKRLDGPLKNEDHTTKSNNKRNTPISPVLVLQLAAKYAGEDQELLDAILGLLENRAVMKPKPKPVQTVRAMKGILRQLDELSGGDRGIKLALLEKATLSNWLTVYPLKPDETPETAEDEEGVRYI